MGLERFGLLTLVWTLVTDRGILAEASIASAAQQLELPMRLTFSSDGSHAVVTTSSEASVFDKRTGGWSTVGTYTLEMLAGGMLGSAFSADGKHVCAAWQPSPFST